MKVTRLNRSRTTCTTVPLAFGNFRVSFLNASAGMTAKVVSTVALAIVPLNAIEPVSTEAAFLLGRDRLVGRDPSARSVELRGRIFGEAGADLALVVSKSGCSGCVVGDVDVVAGKEVEVSVVPLIDTLGDPAVAVPSLSPTELDLRLACPSEIGAGLATRRPSKPSAS